MKIYIFLSILILFSFAFVESSIFDNDDEEENYIGDCLEIKKINKEYEIYECIENEKGKVTRLDIHIHSDELSEAEKLLTYETITDLSFRIWNADFFINKEKYKFPKSITNLKNLKNLVLDYDIYDYYCEKKRNCDTEIYTEITLDRNYISSLSKTLEKLTLKHIDVNQNTIDEIATLNNLKDLSFESCFFSKNIKFNSLNNIKKISFMGDNNPHYFDKSNYSKLPDTLYSMENLEELLISDEDIILSEKIGNLKKLRVLNLNDNNIEKLPKEISKLEKLEELYLNYNSIKNPSILFEIKNLKHL